MLEKVYVAAESAEAMTETKTGEGSCFCEACVTWPSLFLLTVSRWKPNSLSIIRYLPLTDASKYRFISIFNIVDYGVSESIVWNISKFVSGPIFLTVCTAHLLAWLLGFLWQSPQCAVELLFTRLGTRFSGKIMTLGSSHSSFFVLTLWLSFQLLVRDKPGRGGLFANLYLKGLHVVNSEQYCE